ncbi:hypothetical protein AURDEDRAFT_17971, partial [Auricularia subglabra TFB-10046 SS5]
LTLSLRSAYHNSPIIIREIVPPLVESELHDAQGMSEALSKIWVPLQAYIPDVIRQLVETENAEITYGASRELYAKFETGKYELVLKMA